MSECPHCKKELQIPDCVYGNAESYLPHSLTTVTNCCGFGLIVFPRVVYRITKAPPEITEDDWGEPIRTDATKGGE